MSKKCPKVRYQTNFSDSRGQVALMPGVFNLDSSVLSFFATAPFQIIGLATIDALPAGGPPDYPNTLVSVSDAATQDANSQWIQALYIAMGFANAQDEGVSNGMTAYNSDVFSEYMYRYLNPDAIRAWYNLYIMPPNEIIQFWKDQNSLAVPANDSLAMRQLARYLFENASIPLFNPPGLYQIAMSANTEPYFSGLTAYLTGLEGGAPVFITEQVNAPCISQNNPLGNPLANIINSINFAGNIPDAILWT